MKHKYGTFQSNQFEKYKVKLHRDLFYLLLYKDPKTSEQFEDVNFEKYFVGLMRKIDGLNELLFCPSELVELLSLLEAAYQLSCEDDFQYSIYRKLVLDAHNLVDKICASGGDDGDKPKQL